MAICFFDTSALEHRYFPTAYSRRTSRLITNSLNECVIADITILDIASKLARRTRSGLLTPREYETSDLKFWRDILAGSLQLHKTGQREFLRARNLLRLAGVIKKENLRSADALSASSCLELALERQEKITFYTSKRALYDLIRQIDAYKTALTLAFVGPP